MSFLLISSMLLSQRWYASVTYKKESAKGHWLPGPCPVSQLACSGLAQNPELLIDGSARSRKVAWSSRPLAAVYSGRVHQRIRLASSLSQGTSAAVVDSGVRCSRPARSPSKGPAVPTAWRRRPLLRQARSPVAVLRPRRMWRRCPCSSSPSSPVVFTE
jgi:hypothetical protein